jgi:hypothetical protein
MAKRSTGTWFVYILRCADGTLYTGITADLARRTEQHNAGTDSTGALDRMPAGLHCYSRTMPLSFTCHNCPLSTSIAVSQSPLQQFVSRHFK